MYAKHPVPRDLTEGEREGRREGDREAGRQTDVGREG